MVQPTFAFPCEYGFTARRSAYGERIKISTTSSGATPSSNEIGITAYEITTVPIGNDVAVSLDNSLRALKGSYFYSRFYFDDQQYKYRIVDDTWDWQAIGPTANIFTLAVERVYEPTVEFAIDYGQSQTQQVSAHLFRLATTSGTAIASGNVRSMKQVDVTTKPMSKASAIGLNNTLTTLSGSSFYSQIYLDQSPVLYRLQPYEWKWSPEGEDAYVCTFTMAETMANTTDIPCVDTLSLERRSRVKNVQFGDGYEQNSPDGINSQDYFYAIETLPLSDAQAVAIESGLTALQGNTFFAKFKNDTQVYKYRLDGNNWTWQSQGKDANVFSFRVKRAYDL